MVNVYIAMNIIDADVLAKLAAKQVLASQQVTGDFEPPEAFHVTLDYLGDIDTEDIPKVIDAVKLVEANAKQLDIAGRYVYARNAHRFNMGAMWIGMDQSMVLYRIHHALLDAMAYMGLEHRKDDFDGYTPHITIAYDTPDQSVDIGTDVVAVPVNNITVWDSSVKCGGAYLANSLYMAKL